MKRKDPKEKSVPLSATLQPETSEALEVKVKEIGNRSLIVDTSLRLYLKLETSSNQSQQQKAS